MADSATVNHEFEEAVARLAEEASPKCVEFLHDLVTLPSPSRGERLACERVMREMESLGYRDVHLDPMGNVLGRLGSGPRVLAFDAHIDTVGISNPTRWRHDPFRGIVTGGTCSAAALPTRREAWLRWFTVSLWRTRWVWPTISPRGSPRRSTGKTALTRMAVPAQRNRSAS